VLTIAAVVAAPQLGQSLFPAFKERDLLMHWVTTPGTSDAEMARTTADVSKELQAVPGVRSFGAHIGQALLGEEVAGVNLGENWISLDPSVDYEATLAKVRAVAEQHPGMFREVQTYLDERIQEVLTGGKEPIIVRVFGENLNVLRDKAAEIQKLVAGVPGAVDAHVDISTDVPQIEVTVNLPKAQQYGIKPGDVRRAASTLIAGEEVGDIFRNGKAYDTVVWSTPATRSSVTSIENLVLNTPSGKRVHLKDVATVAVRPTPNSIDREGGSRRLDVGATFAGNDLGSVVNQVEARVKNVSFPEGYHAEVIGEYEERQAAQRTLFGSAALAGFAILMLLQASFGRWRLALLIFATLPMALVGGVLSAYFTGGVISLGSLVGFFTVFGIAARNGILLINHFQTLERDEGEPVGPGLVLRGAKERLSPILMTTLATGLALVPLVVLGDRPGHEIEHPLAIVVLGGLVTSTLLNLLLVPSLYLRSRLRQQRRERKSAEATAS